MLVPEKEIKALTFQSVDDIVAHSKFFKETTKDGFRVVVKIEPGYRLQVTEYMPLILAIAVRLCNNYPPTLELWEGKGEEGGQLLTVFPVKAVKMAIQSSELSGLL